MQHPAELRNESNATHLVEALKQVDYPTLDLLLVQTGRGGIETDTLVGEARSELSRTSNRRATDLEGNRSANSTGNRGSQRADNSGTEHDDGIKTRGVLPDGKEPN